MEYFLYLCCQIINHFKYEYLQTSLFPRQGEFSSERFESFLTNYNIESIVSSSINAAFDYVVSSPIEVLRVKSDVMNEQVFNKIRDGLLENGIVSENNFMMSRAGNVKNCFTIDDYIFVIAKEGAPHNNTKVTDNILNQSCDKDIIQIQYVINNGWTELAGMRFVYEYYGHAVYTHDINQYGESYFGLTNTSVESDVDEPTITIKPGIKRQVSNE